MNASETNRHSRRWLAFSHRTLKRALKELPEEIARGLCRLNAYFTLFRRAALFK